MFVGERMTRRVMTIHPDMPVQDAIKMMHVEHIRRLPVVDQRGRLVGIVTESDLQNATPSEATTLSVWEIGYLLSKITVERVMTRQIITVHEDTPLEEAARIMADNKIGALPVVKGDDLIGIITETDLFKVFLELLGARYPGVRVSAVTHNVPGTIAKLTHAISEMGGNIVSFATYEGDSPNFGRVTFKVTGVDPDTLKKAIDPFVERINDLRETK
jgi:acetoin utilization protein AcuB